MVNILQKSVFLLQTNNLNFMKIKLIFIVLIASLLLFSGCLTVEKKEYKYNIKNDGTLTLTINYYNIMSQDDDGADVSFKDFGELISDYVNGEKLLESYPEGKILDKKLFEKDGKLCGTAVFEFPGFLAAKLKQYKDKGPIMIYLGAFSETFENSNGDYLGTDFPMIFWDENQKELSYSTIVTSDISNCRPLIKHYKTWEETK